MAAPLRAMARFNRIGLNRVTRPSAARLGGFGVVVHRGRRSGRGYWTPVNVFRTARSYVIDADWVKNVLTADGWDLETRGRLVRLSAPRLFHDESRRDIGAVERQILRLAGVADFLELVPASARVPERRK